MSANLKSRFYGVITPETRALIDAEKKSDNALIAAHARYAEAVVIQLERDIDTAEEIDELAAMRAALMKLTETLLGVALNLGPRLAFPHDKMLKHICVEAVERAFADQEHREVGAEDWRELVRPS